MIQENGQEGVFHRPTALNARCVSYLQYLINNCMQCRPPGMHPILPLKIDEHKPTITLRAKIWRLVLLVYIYYLSVLIFSKNVGELSSESRYRTVLLAIWIEPAIPISKETRPRPSPSLVAVRIIQFSTLVGKEKLQTVLGRLLRQVWDRY